MNARRYIAYGLAGWIILLAHFWGEDAFILSLVLTPPLAALLIMSIRSGNLALSLFMGLALVSHAIAPPFFFMNRDGYSYGGGFGAVKDFNFEVPEFLGIYAYVLLFLTATVLFALSMNSRFARAGEPRLGRLALRDDKGAERRLTRIARTRAGLILALFIVFVGAPLSLWMYSQRIGITGIEPNVLPYRLTGILTYFRMFVVPVVLFGLYSKSNRTLPVTALIISYTALGGFASASRYFVFSTVVAVALFSLVDRKMMRFYVVTVATAAIFVLVTASRDYVYSGYMPLLELIQTTVAGYDPSDFSAFEFIGGVANRLWGPQDVVLAFQYDVPNRLAAIGNYFTSRVVVSDLTYEFYGMVFSGDSAGFGVGIGYISWMILLANRSIFALLGLALITACLLSASERLSRTFRVRPGGHWNSGGQAIAFLFVYFLYTSTINWWYQAFFLVCVSAWFLALREPFGGVTRARGEYTPRRRVPVPRRRDWSDVG